MYINQNIQNIFKISDYVISGKSNMYKKNVNLAYHDFSEYIVRSKRK